MKSALPYTLVIVLLAAILCTACKQEEEPKCFNIACTEEFRSITVTIKDQDGAAVILDDYYTFLNSRSRFKVNSGSQEAGEYPVATDADMELLAEEGTTLIFVGVINEENVVEHQMMIGKDCCHIQLIEGERTVTIN